MPPRRLLLVPPARARARVCTCRCHLGRHAARSSASVFDAAFFSVRLLTPLQHASPTRPQEDDEEHNENDSEEDGDEEDDRENGRPHHAQGARAAQRGDLGALELCHSHGAQMPCAPPPHSRRAALTASTASGAGPRRRVHALAPSRRWRRRPARAHLVRRRAFGVTAAPEHRRRDVRARRCASVSPAPRA